MGFMHFKEFKRLVRGGELDLYHRQLPSPCNDRGSGFNRGDLIGTVRYNLQLDGRRQ